jgi:acyl-CoA synthetase (NDP forming)
MNSGVAALLKPQSIAIVGASDKSRWSRTAFDNLRAFIDYFIDDPGTRAIALLVETLRNPTGFIASAQRVLQAVKPIVVLKVGASEATARSAAAHTGALVGDDRVFEMDVNPLWVRGDAVEALDALFVYRS